MLANFGGDTQRAFVTLLELNAGIITLMTLMTLIALIALCSRDDHPYDIALIIVLNMMYLEILSA